MLSKSNLLSAAKMIVFQEALFQKISSRYATSNNIVLL
jgi:hypothetical protein